MNELEELHRDTVRRSKHLWAHLNAMRDCASEGLPIVVSNIRQQCEQLLPICQTESVRQGTLEICESLVTRQSFALDNVLFNFAYSIAEAQSLDCIRLAFRADSGLCVSTKGSVNKDDVDRLEHAGLVQRAEFLLAIGKDIKVFVPHMKDELRVSTLIELSQLRNEMLHGHWDGLNKPIADLKGKLDYLRNTCIYLSDLVGLKYGLFKPIGDRPLQSE